MPRKTVAGIVATTHRLQVYDGWKMDLELLGSLQGALESGGVVWRAHHDARVPIDARVTSTEIKTLDDGEHALFVTLDVDEDDWKSGGDLRGFSFTAGEALLSIRDDQAERPRIQLHADAACYSDEAIHSASETLSSAFDVDAGRLYQFSEFPPPTILIEIPWEIIGQIAMGAAGGLVTEAILWLVRANRSDKPSIVDVRASRGDQRVQARIESKDEETIRRAIEKLPGLDFDARYQDFDEEDEDWRGPGYM